MMAKSYEGFRDIDIPMLSEMKVSGGSGNDNEAILKKYTDLIGTGKPIQFICEMVNADGNLQQILRPGNADNNYTGIRIELPSDQVYENTKLTPIIAKRCIGRHFTAEVTEVDEKTGKITVSRIKAIIGDGSARDRANRRIRQLVGAISRQMAPLSDGLHKQAEAEAKAYALKYKNERGRELHEKKLTAFVNNRYAELFEQKKDEIKVNRCIVPATVEGVQSNRIILNLFNLDIVGIVSRANWSTKSQIPLAEQAKVGDVVDVEVLYHADVKYTRDPKLQSGWVCSRKNLVKESVDSNWKRIAEGYLKSSIEVVCDRVFQSTAGLEGVTSWIGHIKGTEFKVFSRFSFGRIAISKGASYLVHITGLDENRMNLLGKTIGYVFPDGKGTYVPTRKPRPEKDKLAEVTEADRGYEEEESIADRFGKERPNIEGFE